MIKIIEGNLFDSKSNFIVHQVNAQSVMGAGVTLQVAKRYPHVDKEYRSYVHHCKKNKIPILGTVQYVPVDVWAIGLTDTMKNDNISKYYRDYQYIVNLFGQETYGFGLQTDLNAVRKGFIDIRDKALKIGASIAIPYRIGSCRGGANWSDVYDIIKDVFGKTDLDVTICKYDLG